MQFEVNPSGRFVRRLPKKEIENHSRQNDDEDEKNECEKVHEVLLVDQQCERNIKAGQGRPAFLIE
jgi:hypothetical protein